MGLDAVLDVIQQRKEVLTAEQSIIHSIEDALAQDLTVDAVREQAKSILAQARANAQALDFTGCAGQDKDLFVGQIAALQDSLS